jgi:predicted RND superfamily exporter protein
MIRKRILKTISHLCLRHYRKVLFIFFGLFAIAFLLTGSLRFDPDFLKLFPAEKGPIKLYMENLKETGNIFTIFEHLDNVYPIFSNRYEEVTLKNKNEKITVHAIPQCQTPKEFDENLKKNHYRQIC